MNIDIVKAITELNDAFFEGKTPADFAGFEYRGNGYGDAIYFMGVRIWTDDDDTRTFDEEKNEYESYIKCFAREANIILDKLKSIKKHLNRTAKKN